MTFPGRLLVVAAVSLTTAAATQTPQQPPRDIRSEAVGAGVISGVVVEDAEGRPLRRAAVQLASTALMTTRQFFTRDDGSFVFDGLPPGSYSLSASRSGYMNTQFGAQRQGGTGSAIALAADQQMTKIVLKLSRYAAITGVVYDQNGEPAAGIAVEAMRYTMRTGSRLLSSVYGRAILTDDRGVFRLSGLLPGEYYVAAGPPLLAPIDVQVLSTVDVDRALQLLKAPAATAAEITFERQRQAFAPVFYPGAVEFSAAQTITLRQGEERGGVDVRLQLVPAARVTGTVTPSDGRTVAGLEVTAMPISDKSSLELFNPYFGRTIFTDPQGRFAFPTLIPGRYTIIVTSGQPGIPPQQTRPVAHWALADIVVAGADINLDLTLQAGATVSGKVIFNGATPPPNPREAGVRGSFQILDWPAPSVLSDPAALNSLIVQPDGSFVATGLPPGRYRLTSQSTMPVWALRSTLVNGVDSLDTPFVVRPGQNIDNASIVFTDRPAEISGTLQTIAGTPTADLFIIVFAADKSFWTPSSRRNAMARPTSAGQYAFKNLPPGDYLVVAVTDAETGDWWNPAWLEPLAAVASKITLAEGEKKTLDLRIGR